MLDGNEKPDLRLINPLTFAFLGDGIFEMLAREEIVRRYTSLSANKLHSLTVELVCAKAQAMGFERIKGSLSEEEMTIFKRGRNSNSVTPPRHSSAAQYRTATGVEALFGYLYLKGDIVRINELFKIILSGDRDEKSNDPDSEDCTVF